MHIRDYVLGCVVILLLISTVVPIFSGSTENNSESSSIAPYQEFYEPDNKTLRYLYEENYSLTFNYSYMMDYEIVPRNLVMFLNGTCTYYGRYRLTVSRPDGENITLLDLRREETDYIDERTSIRHGMSIRENIYAKISHILREQEENWSDPGAYNIDPTKVLFGEINKDVFVDPDPLKGEYEIIVEIIGKDIEMNFGEEETKLSILSKPASEPRNLEGKYKDGKVELEWDEPEEEGGSEIVQYDIYRATALYNYEYIGNVSGDQTEYVDEFEGKTLQNQDVIRGDILYYKVVAINEDDYHYLVNSPGKISFWDRYEFMSLEEIIHLPYEKTEQSDMSYKWVMDYSSLSEDTFEDRVNMDSVKTNKMEGGDVFFYDLSKSGEEDGKIVYEYEGGFYSKGEVDMVLEDGEDVRSDLDIEMSESWCDFSGKIWAEETSGSGYEGLKVVNQSIHSEGQVSASLNNTFDFPFEGNETHWEVSRDLDIEWSVDLQLDYERDNGWIVLKENTTYMTLLDAFEGEFNYSGSLDAEGTLQHRSNHFDEEKKTEGEVSTEISGTQALFSTSSAQGSWGSFSPLVGASNIGYYLALDEALNASMGNLKNDQDPFSLAFSTNCQRDDLSTKNLYRYQYMDPMALPGLGSFLGTGLKRANLTNSGQELEVLVNVIIRQKRMSMEEEPEEGWDEWEENVTDEILETIVFENPWGIHQYNGIYRWDYFNYGAIDCEPLGYFASKPLSEDEIDSYNEDREQFFEDQMAGEKAEEDDDGGLFPGYTFVALLVSILLSVIIHKRRKTKWRS